MRARSRSTGPSTTRLLFRSRPARGPVAALLVLAAGASAADAQDHEALFGKHTYAESERAARWLADLQPAAEWSAPASGEAADIIEFIDDERVLVGIVEVANNGDPRHGDLMLLDASSGAVVWRAERRDLEDGSYRLLLADSLLVLVGEREEEVRLFGYDAATGHRIWEVEADQPVRYTLEAGTRSLLLMEEDGGDTRLQARSLDDGSVRWTRRVDAGPWTGEASIFAVGGWIGLAAGGVSLVSPADGSVEGPLDLGALDAEAVSVLPLDDGFLAWDEQRMARVRMESGRVAWATAATPGRTEAVHRLGGDLLRISVGQDGAAPVLDVVDVDDGSLRWRHEVSGKLASPVAEQDDLLLYATGDRLVGLDRTSGEPRFSHDLRPELVAASPVRERTFGMPDRLRAEPGVLFLAREQAGVAAFDLPTGRERWYREHLESSNYAVNYTAEGRFAYILDARFVAGQSLPETLDPIGLGATQGYSPLLAQAQQDYQAARQSYDALSSDASRADRASANLDVQISAGRQLAAMRIDMAMGRVRVAAQAVAALASFADALRRAREAGKRRALVERARYAMDAVQLMQGRLFQSGYYVRPFYVDGRGRGVTLVDQSTGRRSDLVFSPHSPPSIGYGVDLPSFAVSPDGGRLVMVGIGVDADAWERRDHWDTHVPSVSVMSYRTDDLTFAEGPNPPVSLAEIARAGDLEELKRRVAEGRTVDDVELGSGDQALHGAVVGGHLEMVRWLIAAGADLNGKNAAGDAPIDYAFNAEAAGLLVEAGAAGEPPTVEVAASPELAFYSDPLFGAVTMANVAEIRRLVGEGADVNLPLGQGEILLHYAAALGNAEVVATLLELGADVDARNAAGKKPEDVAWSDAVRDVFHR